MHEFISCLWPALDDEEGIKVIQETYEYGYDFLIPLNFM